MSKQNSLPLSHILSLPQYSSTTTTQYISQLYHHSSQTYIMPAATQQYQYQYQPTGSLPISVPGKQPQPHYARHNRNSSGYSQYSVSPPEAPESVATSSGAGLYSSASSQYASSEYDSASSGATSVDLLDYMGDRLSTAYNPIPLDRNTAKQAQM